MDELDVFCARVLGNGPAAAQAALEAREGGDEDRVARLSAAVAVCRASTDGGEITVADPAVDPARDTEAAPELTAGDSGLAQTVARELETATAGLLHEQRAVLALRELLGLSYEQIAGAMGVATTAVAPVLAQARLQLRIEMRGPVDQTLGCAERDRAVRMMAQRQDSEPLDEAQDSWLLEHLGGCVACRETHAAMLEASVCYRAWPFDDGQWERRDTGPVSQSAGTDAVQ